MPSLRPPQDVSLTRRLIGGAALVVTLTAILLNLTHAFARNASVFEQIDLLVDVRHELVSNYVEEPDGEAMVRAAVRGMVESLHDPYTTYLAPEQLESFEQALRGSFSGIGAEITPSDDRIQIVTPLEDSPAWNAGVMAGDVILEIDGVSTLNMSVTEAVQRLTGEPGTDVSILVRHESGEEQPLTITRAVINVQSVRGLWRNGDHHYQWMIDPDRRIGYVRLTTFGQQTTDELRDVLEQLKGQGVRGLILDLRFNPGGLLTAARDVSDMFLPGDRTIVSVKGRRVPEQVLKSTDETLLPDVELVVLANEASASASEIVTGALSENDRALFVGARTFGKGSVQQVRELEQGQGALKLTNAYYYLPSGRNLNRRQVGPGDGAIGVDALDGEDDTQTWGVDPPSGAYVPMSPDEVRAMLEARRDRDVLRRSEQDNGSGPVSPERIEAELKDPQLAAALRAVRGRLETGQWPTVGMTDVDAALAATQRQNLSRRRSLLLEQLEEVEKRLAELAGGEADDAPAETQAEADADADAAETEGDTPAPGEVSADADANTDPQPEASEPADAP